MMAAHALQLDIKIYKYLCYVYFLDGQQAEHEPGMHPCSKASWGAVGKALPAGWSRQSFCPCQHRWDTSGVLSLQQKKGWTYWINSSQGPQSMYHERFGELGLFRLEKRSLMGLMCLKVSLRTLNKVEPVSPLWYPRVRGSGHNFNST